MDTEVQRMYDRMQLYFLLQEQPDLPASVAAQVINRSERWVRKWQRRFSQCTSETFAMFQSKSRAPKSRLKETTEHIKKIIADLRDELSIKYHRTVGARIILLELHKYAAHQSLTDFIPQSASTVHRILKELGYIQTREQRNHIPVELPKPNEEWEMDFGEIRIDVETKLEIFLVLDRGTSRVVYLEGSTGYNAESALEAVARLFVLHGLPQRIRFDRDPRFVGAWTQDSYPSALLRFLRVLGVTDVICPARRPDLKPFVERCIGTLKREWLARFSLNNYADAIDILPGFHTYHNTERIHLGRACQGQTPDEAFPNLPSLPVIPDTVDPDRWIQAQHRRVFRRRISSNGTIQIDKHVYYVDAKRAKTNVMVYLDARQKAFYVIQDQQVLATLEIKGLQHESMDFQSYLWQMKREARSIEIHRLMRWYRRGEVT